MLFWILITNESRAELNLAKDTLVQSSSVFKSNRAENAVDGVVSNDSRWLSQDTEGPHTLEIDFGKIVKIGCIQIITGWQEYDQWTSPVRNFRIEFHQDGKWTNDSRTRKENNSSTAVEICLEQPVKADKIRFISDDSGFVRIAEIRVFEWSTQYPPMLENRKKIYTEHPVFVNQSGYNLNWPKRFTAPMVKERADYTISDVDHQEVLFRGEVIKGVGDFSDFKPVKRGVEYIITVAGESDLKAGKSDPFQIEPGWMQTVSLEPALRFMQDARSVIGTHPSCYGGCPWRDGTYYSFEVPSLILMYLSHQSIFDQLPVEINTAQEKKRVMDPGFRFVKTTRDENALQTTRRYFTELAQTIDPKAPDIVKLIHWGIGWYLIDPQSHDPSGDPLGDQVHSQTVEQFAYFLYGYPFYQQYVTEDFYTKAYDFAFSQWQKVGLFEVDDTIGTFKGRHCPGHSIMPNLMMYEVSKRTEREDSKRFLKAAQDQTRWIIDELDWNDPKTTKGQRMSEHKLMTGLVFFLERYPQHAPDGLQEKIEQWIEIMISRSDNMWDFRRYDETDWSLPRFTSGSHGGAGWNEPGNIAGFPGICFAAASVTKNPEKKQRLMEIGVAHFDTLFGRNPLGAHSGYLAVDDFVGVERGWPKQFTVDWCARLELVRGTLNSSCTTEHYPFNPEQTFRHVEGWVAFNAAFNVSLAYTPQEKCLLGQ
jgi:hypothetical protein